MLEFTGAYIYDRSGTARWVVGSAPRLSGGTLPLFGYTPHCPACAWLPDWAGQATGAGSLTIQYNGSNRATLDTVISLPAAYPGNWNRNSLPLAPIVDP